MSDDTLAAAVAAEAPAPAAPVDPAPLVSDLTDGEKVHHLKTTRGAVALLALVVKSPGWAKTVKQTRRGNRLRKRLAPLVGKEPKHEDDDAADAWAAVPLPVSMGERDREMAKACVQHFSAAGSFQATDQVVNLFDELGLVEE